jgi:uncharacterized membrane protein
MSFKLAYDDNGNSYIQDGTDLERIAGLVGATVLTSKNQVPMNVNKGCQLETYVTMDDNIEEVIQMMSVADLFQAIGLNVPSVAVMEVKYTAVDKETGSILVRYITPFTVGVQETVLTISLR